MNLCLNLITLGQEDMAFLILKTFPTLQSDGFNADSPNLGNFFLRHCVNTDKVYHIYHTFTDFFLNPVHKKIPTVFKESTLVSIWLLGINFKTWLCVCVLQAVEKISHYCKELQESNLHSSPFIFSLQCALGAKNTGIAHAFIYLDLERPSCSYRCEFILFFYSYISIQLIYVHLI